MGRAMMNITTGRRKLATGIINVVTQFGIEKLSKHIMVLNMEQGFWLERSESNKSFENGMTIILIFTKQKMLTNKEYDTQTIKTN